MLETRKLLPGVRPKTRIEALTLAIFLAESELVEACHNPKTREWAIECKAAILTYQEMLQQENNSMCDQNINLSAMAAPAVHAEINRVEDYLDKLHARLIELERQQQVPVKNMLAMEMMAKRENYQRQSQQDAQAAGKLPQVETPAPQPVLPGTPQERVRAKLTAQLGPIKEL